MTVPTRPVLRYHGGKWRLAPWIISHFPAHRVYVEPFGGAASVLLRKTRSRSEVYNDLDGEVVNLFRVLREPTDARELRELVRLTPFARTEYEAAHEITGSPVERARRLLVRSFMGFGSRGASVTTPTGFRITYKDGDGLPAQSWATTLLGGLEVATERLRGVVIEQRPAVDVIERFDVPEAVLYVDPPYVMSSRTAAQPTYHHEMTDADHRALAGALHRVHGMVVLSGYASPLYEELYGEWQQRERESRTNLNSVRREVLWLNPAASEALTAAKTVSAAGPL